MIEMMLKMSLVLFAIAIAIALLRIILGPRCRTVCLRLM